MTEVLIDDERMIFEIQKDFNLMFPYLQLEFLAKPNVASPKNTMKCHFKKLSECRTVHNSGTLNITPAMTVTNLEESFRTIYGLSAQVFRKSGKAWLETTLTNAWTLEEQNRHGRELSGGFSGL